MTSRRQSGTAITCLGEREHVCYVDYRVDHDPGDWTTSPCTDIEIRRVDFEECPRGSGWREWASGYAAETFRDRLEERAYDHWRYGGDDE